LKKLASFEDTFPIFKTFIFCEYGTAGFIIDNIYSGLHQIRFVE